jgi:hypothetical protein
MTVVNQKKHDACYGQPDVGVINAEPDPPVDEPDNVAYSAAPTSSAATSPTATVSFTTAGSSESACNIAEPCEDGCSQYDKTERLWQSAPQATDFQIFLFIHAIAHGL